MTRRHGPRWGGAARSCEGVDEGEQKCGRYFSPHAFRGAFEVGRWGPISRDQEKDVLIKNLAVIEEQCGLSIRGGGSDIGPEAVANFGQNWPPRPLETDEHSRRTTRTSTHTTPTASERGVDSEGPFVEFTPWIKGAQLSWDIHGPNLSCHVTQSPSYGVARAQDPKI